MHQPHKGTLNSRLWTRGPQLINCFPAKPHFLIGQHVVSFSLQFTPLFGAESLRLRQKLKMAGGGVCSCERDRAAVFFCGAGYDSGGATAHGLSSAGPRSPIPSPASLKLHMTLCRSGSVQTTPPDALLNSSCLAPC